MMACSITSTPPLVAYDDAVQSHQDVDGDVATTTVHDSSLDNATAIIALITTQSDDDECNASVANSDESLVTAVADAASDVNKFVPSMESEKLDLTLSAFGQPFRFGGSDGGSDGSRPASPTSSVASSNIFEDYVHDDEEEDDDAFEDPGPGSAELNPFLLDYYTPPLRLFHYLCLKCRRRMDSLPVIMEHIKCKHCTERGPFLRAIRAPLGDSGGGGGGCGR